MAVPDLTWSFLKEFYPKDSPSFMIIEFLLGISKLTLPLIIIKKELASSPSLNMTSPLLNFKEWAWYAKFVFYLLVRYLKRVILSM